MKNGTTSMSMERRDCEIKTRKMNRKKKSFFLKRCFDGLNTINSIFCCSKRSISRRQIHLHRMCALISLQTLVYSPFLSAINSMCFQYHGRCKQTPVLLVWCGFCCLFSLWTHPMPLNCRQLFIDATPFGLLA